MATRYRNRQGLNRAQIKIVLDFMGISFREQGKTAAENKARLALEKQNHPDEYDRAIDIVVNHIAPKPTEVRSETFYKEWGELIEQYFGEGKEKVIEDLAGTTEDICNQLDQKANDMWKVLENSVKTAIQEATEQYKVTAIKVGNKKPVPVDGILHKNFADICRLAQERMNIMLVGPAGCGKSHLAEQVAKALDLDYSSQACSEGMSESMLSGWLIPIGDGGRFEYVASEFVRLYENGGVFLLDEMDAADPNVLVFMNQSLANGYMVIPQRHESPMIRKHKDFVCIAACNTYGAGGDTVYHGRNALDGATLDRFRIGVIPMDYDENIEQKLISSEVLVWGQSMRSMINNHKLRRIMSTRFLIHASTMMQNQNWTMDRVKTAYFSDWSPEEARMVGEEI